MSKRKMSLALVSLALLATACQPQVVEVTRIVTQEVEVTRELEKLVEATVEVTRIVEASAVPPQIAPETVVVNIPLAGPLASQDAEISGMAWYGDNLILLPQYPNFSGAEGDGFLYALPKDEIVAYLAGETYAPLEPTPIPFTAPDVQDTVAGFEGYEAIAFVGDEVYMTIESETGAGLVGYLLFGTISPNLRAVTMDTANLVPIPAQSGVSNMCEESLVVTGDGMFTIYEANGAGVNAAPVVNAFDMSLAPVAPIPLANVEYRITDATELDGDDRFWAINYFFPGDEDLLPEEDSLADEYGEGATHAASAGVERLIEFQYSADAISLTDTPPIQLQLMADGSLRNWEGLVRLDESGFLLATDKYPQTILAFVPLPGEEEDSS